MGATTKIEWCDKTFNPWTRCERVSPACDNCYAETWAGRAKHPVDGAGVALPLWGADAPRDPTSATNWKQPAKWNAAAEAAGMRARVFCASLADVFEDHPAITASGARERLWTLIEATTSLDWMLLTKRPENIMTMIPERWRAGLPSNVWIGTTVESQEWADKRIPHLLAVPAAVRFLSIEPMVGPVDLNRVHLNGTGAELWCPHCGKTTEPFWQDSEAWCGNDDCEAGPLPTIPDLVIVGGESGSNARPLHPSWPAALRDQCVSAGVAFHFKQWGEYEPMMDAEAYADSIDMMGDDSEWKKMSKGVAIIHHDGRVEKPEGKSTADFEQWWRDFIGRERVALDTAGLENWPDGEEPVAMHYVGKKTAGRLLDGRTWDEMPAPIAAPATNPLDALKDRAAALGRPLSASEGLGLLASRST